MSDHDNNMRGNIRSLAVGNTRLADVLTWIDERIIKMEATHSAPSSPRERSAPAPDLPAEVMDRAWELAHLFGTTIPGGNSLLSHPGKAGQVRLSLDEFRAILCAADASEILRHVVADLTAQRYEPKRCDCDEGGKCPLGQEGSSSRCTVGELRDALIAARASEAAARRQVEAMQRIAAFNARFYLVGSFGDTQARPAIYPADMRADAEECASKTGRLITPLRYALGDNEAAPSAARPVGGESQT